MATGSSADGAAPTGSSGGLGGLLDQTSSQANKLNTETVGTFFTSLGFAAVVFAVQILVFLILKGKLPRIYEPRTYLVPERERTSPPPAGFWRWVIPVFRTSNAEFIQKCGLDAYFFLRYLRMLLKIFVPSACLIFPILLPLNAAGGRNEDFATGPYSHKPWSNVTGLNKLSWGNVRPENYNRYWGHLFLAIALIGYCHYVFYDELRGYIRLRQAYLTSPQHRLRASATTVLVQTIPRKWCTAEALEGLYDVFPGGIRNIWINRNFDELNDKVRLRNRLASKLEQAETALIRKCAKANAKRLKADAEKAEKGMTKDEKKAAKRKTTANADGPIEDAGVSTGAPHQLRRRLKAAITSDTDYNASQDTTPGNDQANTAALVTQTVQNVGKSIIGGIKTVGNDVDGALQTTQGFDAAANATAQPPGNASISSPSRGPQSPTLPKLDFGQELRETSSVKDQPEQAVAEEHTAETAGDITSPDHLNVPSDQPAIKMSMAPLNPRTKKTFWRRQSNVLEVPSPNPRGFEDGDEFPLGQDRHATSTDDNHASSSRDANPSTESERQNEKPPKKKQDSHAGEYPSAIDEEYNPASDEPTWRKYINQKDRDTFRLPIFGQWWLSWLPFVGQKVDTIDYCRHEVARLNLEIEIDQKEPEKFPLMNSAFVQFNHQVAAHMACQAVNHHMPNQMTPRVVEMSPDDVIWDNMSLRWWEHYVRTGIVLVLLTGLVIGWAIPVACTGLLSDLPGLANTFPALSFLRNMPDFAISIFQGILPPALLGLLLFLLPVLLRLLARLQGLPTGMAVELETSNYYFAFLFIEVFLVITLSSALFSTIAAIPTNITSLPTILASNLPRSSNYFFSYQILNALSVSAGALLQIGSLLFWFLLGPLLDSSARDKWSRQVNLPNVQWGAFFPIYTTYAVLGLVYSIISPLILIFSVITFSLFWFTYRYNTLYVTKFSRDTGGLLFPKAINQLFTGIYVLELSLIGLFLAVSETTLDPVSNAMVTTSARPCFPQAIIMVVVFVGTALYQWLLNRSFGPLFRYLPVTLEDDAVARDEEFARAQEKQWQLGQEEEGDGREHGHAFNSDGATDIYDILEARERKEMDDDRQAEEFELQHIAGGKRDGYRNDHAKTSGTQKLDPRRLATAVPNAVSRIAPGRRRWLDRRGNARRAVDVNARGRDDDADRDSELEAALRQHRLLDHTSEDPEQGFGNASSNDEKVVPSSVNAGTGASTTKVISASSADSGAGRAIADQDSGNDTATGTGKDNGKGNGAGKETDTGTDGTHLATSNAGNDRQHDLKSMPVRGRGRRIADALFAGLNDDIEDLTPEERDALTRRAFQHEALRARRPVVWIPRDALGVSDDEIRRTERFSPYIWISNAYAGLDAKARVVYSKSPPDFSELDLIEL